MENCEAPAINLALARFAAPIGHAARLRRFFADACDEVQLVSSG